MKNAGRIFGILLLVVLVVAGCKNERHERNAFKAGKRQAMNQMEQFRNRQIPKNKMMRRGDGRGMGRQMNPGMGNGMGRQMNPGMGAGRGMMNQGMGAGMGRMNPGMRGGMGQGNNQGMMRDTIIRRGNNTMRGMNTMPGANFRQNSRPAQMSPPVTGPVGPGGIFIENIPNVTEKQRKEFEDLIKKQQEDMAKMRSEMAARIKSTLESQRSKLLKIFTDEQKKYINPKESTKR